MSPGPIALLSEKDLSFIPEPPIFTALAAEMLGDHGTDKDGFDSSLNETASLLASSQAVIDGIGADLAEASNALAAPESDSGAQMLADLQPAAEAADVQLNEFSGSLGLTVDGGGVGGGGAVDTSCDMSADFGRVPTPQLNLRELFSIPPADNVELFEGDSNHWSAFVDNIGDQPPDEFVINIRFTGDQPGSYAAKFRVHLLDSETPYTVCAQITLQ